MEARCFLSVHSNCGLSYQLKQGKSPHFIFKSKSKNVFFLTHSRPGGFYPRRLQYDYFSFNFGAFRRFGEIQKSQMEDPRRLPFGNHDVITLSYNVIISLCGPQTYNLSFKPYCHNFYTYEVMEGEGIVIVIVK